MKGFVLCVAILCLAIPSISPIHSGGTDGNGGHYDHSTGEYHFHHGYPAHQHQNGECPYDYEDYDCGREDCNIQGQHYHSNKATTTTTTTTRTTQIQQNLKNDNVAKDSSSDRLVDICFCLFVVGIIIYGNFDKIKGFISKRKKGKH